MIASGIKTTLFVLAGAAALPLIAGGGNMGGANAL
jgi:hypothetical protein